MKTGRLIHVLASDRWSGVERYALDLCRHFQNEGWNVSALTRDAKAVDNKFTAAGIPLVHAPLLGFFDFSTVLTLAKLLRREKAAGVYTVVHVHRYRDALRAVVARRLSGRADVRIVMTYHICAPGRDTWLYRRIYKELDSHLFVSQKARSTFLSTWEKDSLLFPEERLEVVRNSLLTDNFEAPPEPAKGPIVAMYHGRLAPGKGLETLISALGMLPRRTLRLRIVGSGNPDYVDSLRDLARNAGVMESIDWRKHVDDPLPLIAEAHFGIMPSEEPEAFGLSNLEYMASGRPVITTSNGGQKEYLTDGKDSIIVAPKDKEALAAAMSKLACNADVRKAMGQAARDTFLSELSWPRFAREMGKIYIS